MPHLYKGYLVDTTERPDVYQFLDVPEDKIKVMERFAKSYSGSFEIRSEGGEVIWPNEKGFSLDVVLDVL